MENLILIFIIFLIIGGAVCYIYKAKKSGQTCIGCPYAKKCSGHSGGCAGNIKDN